MDSPQTRRRPFARGRRRSLRGLVPADAGPFVAILAYLGAAVAITWPWSIHPGTTLVAPIGGDVSSSIVKWESVVQAGLNPFAAGTIDTLDWPIGIATTPGLDLASVLSALPLWLGTLLIGGVATHGLLGVLGYVLTAGVTFGFVRHVTGSWAAGFVAGAAYGFFPQMHLVVYAATTYSHMWLFILPLWAFWSLTQNPSRRAAILAGLSVVPAAFWTPYFALHVGVIAAACLVTVLAFGPRFGVRRRMLVPTLGIWVAALVVYVGIGVLTSFDGVPDREAGDFYQQSAHPLMFVIPGSESIHADGLDEQLAEWVPRALGANLYVGVSVLVLAAIGFVSAMRRWRRSGPSASTAIPAAALLAAATVVLTFLFSLPPHVAGGVIPMPSWLVAEVVPALRAGQRFVMPLMAGLSVLAGIGVLTLLRFVSRRAVVPVGLLLAAIVAVDLWTRPDGMNERVPQPSPAIFALADEPKGPAVHITEHGMFGGVSQRACLMQRTHGMPLFNNCAYGEIPEENWQRVIGPVCEGLNNLRRLGLRYVVVEMPVPENVAACFAGKSEVGRVRQVAQDRKHRIWELLERGDG